MPLNDTIGPMLKRKGGEIFAMRPKDTVYDAIVCMADKGVGALLVMTDGHLDGIISERDYARKIILLGRSSKETLVEEIMSSPVLTVTSRHTVGECMRIITDNRIRHLPVVENGRVCAVLSIGDLVNWIITAQQEKIKHLEAYISGAVV
ncbi:MAG TPA: CBS domain-containing protein [Acidisarcina sp.]